MELTKGTTYKRYTASANTIRTHTGKVTEAEPHSAFVEAVEISEMYGTVTVSDVVLNRDVENIMPITPDAYEDTVDEALAKTRLALEDAETRITQHRERVIKLEYLRSVGAHA